MSTTVPDFSIALRTATDRSRTLPVLRMVLQRHGFEILCEFPKIGNLEQITRWGKQQCTELMVWSPSHAYWSLLSDSEPKLLAPFHLSVLESGNSVFVTVTDHYDAFRSEDRSTWVELLTFSLADRIRRVLAEVAAQAELPEHYRTKAKEASRF